MLDRREMGAGVKAWVVVVVVCTQSRSKSVVDQRSQQVTSAFSSLAVKIRESQFYRSVLFSTHGAKKIFLVFMVKMNT